MIGYKSRSISKDSQLRQSDGREPDAQAGGEGCDVDDEGGDQLKNKLVL